MRAAVFVILSALAASPAAADMKASFDWGPTSDCFDSKSPPFRVSGVPKGTVKLSFSMTDLNVPDYRHGGGKVEYSGQSDIPYGAFRYKGPCPPRATQVPLHDQALDAKGKELGKTTVSKVFPVASSAAARSRQKRRFICLADDHQKSWSG